MGNFQGYLIKFGNDVFPHEYIIYDSYKVSPDKRIDMDSARNANGILERNVLDHTASTLQFDLRPMDGDEQETVTSFLNNHFSDTAQKKVLIQYWNPFTSSYKSGDFYIPDIEYPIKKIEDNQIYYGKVTLKAIEY